MLRRHSHGEGKRGSRLPGGNKTTKGRAWSSKDAQPQRCAMKTDAQAWRQHGDLRRMFMQTSTAYFDSCSSGGRILNRKKTPPLLSSNWQKKAKTTKPSAGL